jgi:Tfp pilus assembly protein PilV
MPKSRDRQPASVVEQQVAGLDVAVHDAASCAASSADAASRSQRTTLSRRRRTPSRSRSPIEPARA